MMADTTDRQLRPGEAAARLGISVDTLSRWRKMGLIPYTRAHSKAVPMYRQSDVDALRDRRQNYQ